MTQQKHAIHTGNNKRHFEHTAELFKSHNMLNMLFNKY